MYSIICLSSFGSKLDLWSGPFIFLLKVKCFSRLRYPSLQRYLVLLNLNYGRQPTLILNFFLNNNKVFKFKPCNGVDMQNCIVIKLNFFSYYINCSFNFKKFDAPDERIIFLLLIFFNFFK